MLDGESWRTLPAEVVLRAGLDVGVELDRERARRVRRELRRHEAMAHAAVCSGVAISRLQSSMRGWIAPTSRLRPGQRRSSD